jgi:hypothetical protein
MSLECFYRCAEQRLSASVRSGKANSDPAVREGAIHQTCQDAFRRSCFAGRLRDLKYVVKYWQKAFALTVLAAPEQP